MKRFWSLIWDYKKVRVGTIWRVLLFFLLYTNLMRAAQYIPLVPRQISVTVGILILLAGFSLLFDRRSMSDYGLFVDKHTLPDLLFGLIWGALVVAGIVWLEKALGWVRMDFNPWTRFLDGDIGRAFWMAALLFVTIGINEELIYRGFLLRNFTEEFRFLRNPKHRIWASVVLAGLIFGYVHFDNPNATTLSGINLILYGFLFSVPFLLTGSLMIGIGVHITWNLTMGTVWGLTLSGFPPFVSLMVTEQTGPAIWTGGDFGPEGGLICTLSLFVLLLGYLAWIKWTRGEVWVEGSFGIYRPVRLFALTMSEIREEREAMQNKEDDSNKM